jgi:hypothetical protein
MKTVQPNNLHSGIKTVFEQARQSAYGAINFAMVMVYWQIGRCIVEEEQEAAKKAANEKSTLKELSEKLSADLGKGFSVDNLEQFRKFYLSFPYIPISGAVPRKSQKSHAVRDLSTKQKIAFVPAISDALRRELSWTHYRLLIKVDNIDARTWYMNEAADSNWSTRTLERQINTFTYELILSSKNKKGVKKEVEEKVEKASPLDFIKDPCVLEFLQLTGECES